jgi:hypothetical protein
VVTSANLLPGNPRTGGKFARKPSTPGRGSRLIGVSQRGRPMFRIADHKDAQGGFGAGKTGRKPAL